MKRIGYLLIFTTLYQISHAQSYHAIHGNRFGSGLAVYNNPASIVHQPHPWDLTIFAVQQKAYTNIAKLHDYSVISKADKASLQMEEGYYGRKLHAQTDFRLLNARMNIGRNKAVAAGVNIRNYAHLSTSAYNYSSDINEAEDFFQLNHMIQLPVYGTAIQSGWAEFSLSYAQTMKEDEVVRISGGASLKLQRGLAGSFLELANSYFKLRQTATGDPYFALTNLTGQYNYSSNLDSDDTKSFLFNTYNGASIDLGAEMIIKYTGYGIASHAPAYSWKIGLSFLDLGANRYRSSLNSLKILGLKDEIAATELQEKFENVQDIEEVKATISSLATVRNQARYFNIYQPMRMVLNVDKHLTDDFYFNTGFSFNFTSSSNFKTLSVREMDLVTITPRWETRTIAAYLPMQYTTDGNFLVGFAGRLGPVLFGMHNANWVFSKKAIPNGGFYLALTFRGWNFRNSEREYFDCPRF